jgi:hypothetical protein
MGYLQCCIRIDKLLIGMFKFIVISLQKHMLISELC